MIDEKDVGGVGLDEALPEGIAERSGVEASAAATEATRAALRAGEGADPLEGIVDRIREERRPELAFDRAVIEAALDLEAVDEPGLAQLRRDLKAAGVAMTQWSRVLDARRRERRAEEKEAAQRRAREAAAQAREAQARAAEERAAEIAARRAEREDPRAAHFGEVAVDDCVFYMEPGRIWMEEPGPRGTVKTTTLANFSAPIVYDLSEFPAPGARAERASCLSVILRGGAPRTIEVPQRDFDRMEWVGPMLGARAAVAAGRLARDNLRRAIQLMSEPEDKARHGYTGWTTLDAGPAYLHAAGAIAAGEVGVVDVCAPAPVNRFALPAAPTGEALGRARDHVLEFLALEPAPAVMAVVGQAFRAALGEARCSAHVYGGEPGSGKSLLCAFGQGFFGPGFHEDNPPLSWRSGGGDTAVSMNLILAAAGDCVVWIDDLKLSGGHADLDLMRRADQIFSQVFSGKARTMGRREGGLRANPAPRAPVLSSGEVLPRAGNSLVQRLVPVLYPHRMTGGDVMAVRARNAEGVGAGFMAAFLRWVAPRRERLRGELRDREVRAAEEWGLGSTPRAVKLFGAVAVGLRALLAFLREIGADPELVARHEDRARVALRVLAGQYDDVSDEQNPVDTFVRLLGEAIASGGCHVTTPQGYAPKQCHLFGWRPKSSVGRTDDEGFEEGPAFQPAGTCVGHVDLARGRLYVIPSVAFAAVQRAARESNQVVNVDVGDLGRRLKERGYLAHDEYEKNRTFGARLRAVDPAVPGGKVELRRGLLCLRLEAVVPDAAGDSTGAPRAAVTADASEEQDFSDG